MRDIKFRAWHPEWSDMILGYDKPVRFEKREFYPFEFAVGFSHYPEDDRWVLMQFTGLKDKNEKEIFEGDIVNIESVGVAEVKMIDGCWKTYSEDESMLNSSLFGWMVPIEVVGNIFQKGG